MSSISQPQLRDVADPQKSELHIYIVVPVFNRKALVERFLACVAGQTFRDFTVIVVDDGSTDGTAAMIEEKYPAVHLLRGDGNLWWTGATNFGISHALRHASTRDAVLVINDDVEFEPDYLQSLHRTWQSTPKAVIGSVVVDITHPTQILDGGCLVNWWTAKMRRLHQQRDIREFDREHLVDVSMLTGRGVLYPVSVFSEVGLYDDKHFKQCGDTEFPVRAKNRGYRLIVSYGAVVKTEAGRTAGVNVAERYSLGDAVDYFFGLKSNFRLKYRFFLAYNTAKNPMAFVSFLSCDIARITYHFVARLRLRRYRHDPVTPVAP